VKHSERPVVLASHSAQLSGGEIAMARTAAALTRYRPHVLLGEDGPIAERLRDDGVDVDIVALPPSLSTARRAQTFADLTRTTVLAARQYAAEVARHLAALDPLLVHTNSLKAGYLFGVAARVARRPVVWHLRDRLSVDYLSRPMISASRTTIRAVSSIAIANSSSTRATLPAGVPSCVIPSPIGDLSVVHHADRPTADGDLTFTVVGRLAQWKGQDLFLNAFARAFPDGRHRAVVVGGALFDEDEYEAFLQAEVERLGIGDRVEFTGHVADPAEHLARTDVLVHSSVIPEPFGLVIVEGMAAGVPVLAADQGGPAETITHGEDGLLYSMGNVAELATAMRRIADAPPTRVRLASAGHETARRYTADVIAARVERVYDCIATSPSGKARHVVVNGRYRTRSVSGVERFAENITTRLQIPARVRTPVIPSLGRGIIGHLWEQVLLPLQVPRDAVLWSPCNFGPVAARSQVLTVHDLSPRDHPEWFSRGYRRWFDLVVPTVTARSLAVTTVSAFTKRRLVDQFDLAWTRVQVIENGCNLERARLAADQPRVPRARPFVLAVGAADPRKNVASIQDAMRVVRMRHPDLELQIVGGAPPGVFASRAPDRRHDPLDVVAGHVTDEELRELYHSAECLVYASFYEGFGLPPLEAMALGTPVVASRLEPIEEVCGPVAIYVDPTDPADIARGIEAVLQASPAQRAERIRAGTERAAHYSWRRAAGAFDNLFEELWGMAPTTAR
jgi:glycosyltransferase involved in cell wall biosynthesis